MMDKTPETQAADIQRSEAAAAYAAAYSGPISGELIPAQYKVGAVLALIALAVPVFMQPNLVSAAKVLMFYFMLCVGSFCLAVFFFQGWILEKLRLAEDIADMVQDEATVQLTMVNHKLADLNYRFVEKHDASTSEMLPDFLKNLTPFAMLFLNKEKSMMRWAMLGMKFAKSAMDLYKARENDSNKHASRSYRTRDIT
ncbi:MAG: hypothetical protein DKT66_16905 [Candidatus Melainabacteria bacterium]|nr:MAG: hypothetical protein DKT66_16905 [Candidatus Melainabacteria bacterium]